MSPKTTDTTLYVTQCTSLTPEIDCTYGVDHVCVQQLSKLICRIQYGPIEPLAKMCKAKCLVNIAII